MTFWFWWCQIIAQNFRVETDDFQTVTCEASEKDSKQDEKQEQKGIHKVRIYSDRAKAKIFFYACRLVFYLYSLFLLSFSPFLLFSLGVNRPYDKGVLTRPPPPRREQIWSVSPHLSELLAITTHVQIDTSIVTFIVQKDEDQYSKKHWKFN